MLRKVQWLRKGAKGGEKGAKDEKGVKVEEKVQRMKRIQRPDNGVRKWS